MAGWSDKFVQHEKKGESIKTTKEEMERFIGVQMLMSIVKLPRYEMYWSLEKNVEQVIFLFSLKCYKKLCEFLHVADNAEKEKEEKKNDRLFKVKPLLDAAWANCLKIEPECIHSLNEQIIPAKTKWSGGVWQDNPKKLHKWGFKNLVTVGQSDMIYDFLIYGGKNDNSGDPLTAKDIVIRLSKDILKNEGFQLYSDNWFSTMELMLALNSFRIFSTATLWTNHLSGCPLLTETNLKKQVCG